MTEDDVFAFVQASIKSVWALELLVVLRRDRQRPWHPDALVRELRSSHVVVSESLSDLRSAGLVADGPDGLYKYQPASEDLDRLAEGLEMTYAAKPTAVIKAIMNAPNEKLRIFSDAFRFKE